MARRAVRASFVHFATQDAAWLANLFTIPEISQAETTRRVKLGLGPAAKLPQQELLELLGELMRSAVTAPPPDGKPVNSKPVVDIFRSVDKKRLVQLWATGRLSELVGECVLQVRAAVLSANHTDSSPQSLPAANHSDSSPHSRCS